MTQKQEKELVKKARQGNKEAFTELAQEGIRLAVSVAKKEGKEKDFFKLAKAGFSGWLMAFEKYDLSKDYKLSTYSTWWIRAAIREEQTGVSIQKQAKKEKVKKYSWEKMARETLRVCKE
ncbi:MAG TPA: sigma factor [Patescibacteria group bacterium]|nr:sigma factor [Patescibacteria group bacterium]